MTMEYLLMMSANVMTTTMSNIAPNDEVKATVRSSNSALIAANRQLIYNM